MATMMRTDVVAAGVGHGNNEALDWRAVDLCLRAIARRRAALDAEEARWLREAERLQIWRPLAMVSALDYMERVLGYAPHTALERLRVARALGSLPQLANALDDGLLSYSAVRELTRIATPDTESAWCAAARDKNLRQVEALVAGHAPGDRPEDPARPDVRRRKLHLDLAPEVYARLRQAQVALAEQRGARLDDDQLVTALCDAVLERDGASIENTGRAKYQIATVICRACKQGWQHGGGQAIAIDAAAVERALCDAQHVGVIDDAAAPSRAHQDVAPSTRRHVHLRDEGRCQAAGCRSSIGLELHHVVPRTEGSEHDASNLRLLCSACHQAFHRGTLVLDERSGELVAVRPNEPEQSHVGRAALDAAIVETCARDALVGLGFKSALARQAVRDARDVLGGEAPLERLIFEALRRCPRPGS